MHVAIARGVPMSRKIGDMLQVFVCILLIGKAIGHAHFNPLDNLHYERARVELDHHIVISVNETMLESSGAWVNVSWSGVSDPKKSDWIGVYCPPIDNTIDPSYNAPVKYQYAEISPTHKHEGRGFLLFRLINMRETIIMGFLTGGFDDPKLAAISQVIQFQNWNEPTQIHLALTGDPSEMTVMWVTRDAYSPKVKWGTERGKYTSNAQAITSSYSASDMCGSPAIDFGYRDPGFLHKATLTGLQPGLTYYYMCGDDEFGWSQEFSFTAAQPGNPSTTTRISAFGDMGNGQIDDSQQATKKQQQPALNTTRLLNKYLNETDIVLHIGDISYANGYGSVWEEFFDQVESVAANVPYMVCIGNHERDFPNSKGLFNITHSEGECGVPYERRFAMPRPGIDQPWYGFDYGSAHFVLMSTEHFFDPTSPQYKFLDEHLKAVDRTRTPWLIFAGHRPMYVDSTSDRKPDGEQTVAKLLREYLEPLLYEYEVDLALWAHHHLYHRSCPVYQEVCVEDGPVHIVMGMGGQGLSDNVESPKPAWLEYLDYEHWGMTRLTTNSTTLYFEYIHDDDGMVHDTLILKK